MSVIHEKSSILIMFNLHKLCRKVDLIDATCLGYILWLQVGLPVISDVIRYSLKYSLDA